MSDLSRKFIDRDVRDRPGYKDVAEDYVRKYTGEFPYVVDMQNYLKRGGDMSVGQVRAILNCMRNDPRVGGIAVPFEVVNFEQEEKNVQPIRRKPKSTRWLETNLPCFSMAPHEEHAESPVFDEAANTSTTNRCPGVPFLVNREMVIWVGARIHAPLVRARLSAIVHKVATNAKGDQGFIEWSHSRIKYYRGGKHHEYGYGMPTLYVYTGCSKNARSLQSPVLLKEMPDLQILSQLTGLGARTCKRCFSSENG
jgi:hypothetical protein